MKKMRFFVGLHQPSDAKRFDCCFVSVNRLRTRKADFAVGDWIMDSGAFTELSQHGHYRHTPAEYATQINRWKTCGNMLAAVAQDYMCEPFIIAKTGLSIAEHQRLTIDRYRELRGLTGAYVMPVIQGFQVSDYVRHVEAYGDLLEPGAWVGVGSVCKRNTNVGEIEDILRAIYWRRPDLRLHGFGLKTTALQSATVCDLLYSADSMAWSFAARRQGRNANDWHEAEAFARDIRRRPLQLSFAVTQAAA